MKLYDSRWRALHFVLASALAACAGELEQEHVVDLDELAAPAASERGRPHERGERRRTKPHERGQKGEDAAVPCDGVDAGTPPRADAGTRPRADVPRTDGGTPPTPDAGAAVVDAGARDRTAALGSWPGDFCSPVSGEGQYWALCEAAVGLRCQPPPRERADAPSTCACPPGAGFALGYCTSTDWGSEPTDVGTESLGPSTAVGANYGDQCRPGAFPGFPWAECQAARGLECRLPPARPGTFDRTKHCLCPEGSTFTEGRCAKP